MVAIYGGSPRLAERLKPFLDSEDPDPRDIMMSYVDEIRAGLDALWKSDAPEPLRPQLSALAGKLLTARLNDPLTASIRHVPALTDEFPVAMRWLTINHLVYFKMTAQLYKVRLLAPTFHARLPGEAFSRRDLRRRLDRHGLR